MYETQMISDVISPSGKRLCTMTVVTWKPLIGEFNTHRVLSKNSKSSRAVSTPRLIASLIERPHIPVFQKTTPQMQPGAYFADHEQTILAKRWLEWRDVNIQFAQEFELLGVHKQWANRPLEPWMETTVLVSATEWENAINLRVYGGAQTEMRETFKALVKCMSESEPKKLQPGEWSIPYMHSFIFYEDDIRNIIELRNLNESTYNGCTTFDYVKLMCSAGRCATVSYDNLGQGISLMKDFDRAASLAKVGHWSPFEHQAQCLTSAIEWSGNFQEYKQFRKTFKGEDVFVPAQSE